MRSCFVDENPTNPRSNSFSAPRTSPRLIARTCSRSKRRISPRTLFAIGHLQSFVRPSGPSPILHPPWLYPPWPLVLPVIRCAPSMKAPEAYVNWVNAHLGFNPRSQASSDALADFVVADLMATCPTLNAALKSGELKPLKNPNVRTKVAERSIDLVICEGADTPNISVRVSVENKTIMTAHGKARKNRYGDLIAYSNHMHNHNRKCVAGPIVRDNGPPAHGDPQPVRQQ